MNISAEVLSIIKGLSIVQAALSLWKELRRRTAAAFKAKNATSVTISTTNKKGIEAIEAFKKLAQENGEAPKFLAKLIACWNSRTTP